MRQTQPVAISRRRLDRRVLAGLLVAAAVVLISAAGTWGILLDRVDHNDHGPQWFTVPGGQLRVGELAVSEVDHSLMKGMPAMTEADRAPEGYTRFTLPMSLAADGDNLAWTEQDFVITTASRERRLPVRSELGDGTVPAGTQVSGSVTFDLPDESVGLSLRFRGGASIALHVATEAEEDSHDTQPTPAGKPGQQGAPHD